MRGLVISLAIILSVSISELPQVNAFKLVLSPEQATYAWDIAALPDGAIPWSVEPGSPAILREATLSATQAWSDATNGHLKFSEVPFNADAPDGIVIGWDATGERMYSPGWLAQTAFSIGADSRRIVLARIIVNAHGWTFHRGPPFGQSTAAIGAPRDADLDGVLLHEFGHALGMDHADMLPAQIVGAVGFDNYPTMNSVVFPGIESLHVDDVAGIQALYGAGTPPAASGYAAGAFTISAAKTRRARPNTYTFSQLGGDENTLWDFGDGEMLKGESPTHRFPGRGTFIVTAISHGRVASIPVGKGRVSLAALLRRQRQKTAQRQSSR